MRRLSHEPCTAIVSYEVSAEDVELFVEAWNKANDYLKDMDGMESTTLHRAVSANPRFRFVNVAQWSSADDFRAATQSAGFLEASGDLAAYKRHAAVYQPVES
jgi:heme-degrading monooxygenase HmoA